jgi:DNA-binding NtrC family response regulator
VRVGTVARSSAALGKTSLITSPEVSSGEGERPGGVSGKHESTATLVRETVAVRPLGAILRVLDARAKPSTFRLGSGRCVIGAGADADVIVEESTVSRQHASFELVPEGVRVTDLGSRNGTFYLGQRVEKISLSLGARVKLGAASIAIDADGESLRTTAVYPHDEYRGIVGSSLEMRKLFAVLARLEGSLVTVLVTGESGVGKELVAHALHEGSSVASGPLVVVNCGAIPRDLVASELFGHRRGAFTGAVDSRKGAFENADGGTLFLDEIGELPLDLQPVLLRALETGEVRPVGDSARNVRVRVVAATNRDLGEEVKAGRFREDLFYRLAVVRLNVAPLRDRVEDVEPLARRFATSINAPTPLTDDLVEQLKSRSYPGNVRELRNIVQAWAALGSLPEPERTRGGELERLLADLVDVNRVYGDQKEHVNDVFTRVYLHALLAHTKGNQTQAAKLAGLDRSYLGRLLVKYGLSKG